MNDGLTSVLYVEDSPLNVIVMEAMFEQRRDLRLHVAEAGMPAWRMSAHLQPSLLLVDLNLPDCHGSELLKLLRMRRGWARVPAIAVTADSDFDALGAGFQEMWSKPLDVRRTLARLGELLPPPKGALAGAAHAPQALNTASMPAACTAQSPLASHRSLPAFRPEFR
ncbi:response regulator [Roseateles terrae]|uniref:CheY-like chemotaxis protein n=1 Tax=Roseateles terrae TaxID=431060 RepID=A0ABR6GM21_9BURK|nr:response regulator [Roseateles terrae]MBB3192717.1 CheY-like chemotaxis protein [Roseateles terrae]OWQ90002.1 hypothetical protein CDN98_05830 [Roseateles terrae]